jgi:hypothetical protein
LKVESPEIKQQMSLFMFLSVVNNNPTMADKRKELEKECINVTAWFDFRLQGFVSH